MLDIKDELRPTWDFLTGNSSWGAKLQQMLVVFRADGSDSHGVKIIQHIIWYMAANRLYGRWNKVYGGFHNHLFLSPFSWTLFRFNNNMKYEIWRHLSKPVRQAVMRSRTSQTLEETRSSAGGRVQGKQLDAFRCQIQVGFLWRVKNQKLFIKAILLSLMII